MPSRPSTTVALVLAAATLAACEGGMQMPFATADAFEPITTEQQFRAEVVGRQVAYANGAIGTYGPDNTWAITQDGATLASGTWEWAGDRWCYQGTAPQGPVQACERVAISATGVRFTGDDGTEGTLPFLI